MSDDTKFQINFGIPLYTVVSVSIMFGLFLLIDTLFCSSGSIQILYDHSNCLNYHYQYIVRLLYAGVSSTYRPDRTTVYVHIDHSRDRLVRLCFRPRCMKNIFVYKGLHCAKVFLRSHERYRDLRGVIIHHDGTGMLIVHSVEFQETTQPNALIALVQHPVGDEHMMRDVPPFLFGNEKRTPIEPDIRPTTNLTCTEMVIFLYGAINLIFLLTVYLMLQRCRDELCRAEKIFIIGVMSGGAALLAFLLVVMPFRCCIKILNFWTIGRGCGNGLRFLYLMIIVIVGIFTAIVTCDMTGKQKFLQLNQGAPVLSPSVFWVASSGFAIFIFIIILIMLVPLAICIRFIRIGNDFDWQEQMIRNPFGSRTFQFSRTGGGTTGAGDNTMEIIENYKSDEATKVAQSTVAADYYDGTNTEPATGRGFFAGYNPPVRQDPRKTRATGRKKRKVGTDNRYESEDTYINVLANRKKSIRSISTFLRNQKRARNQPPPPRQPRDGDGSRRRGPRSTSTDSDTGPPRSPAVPTVAGRNPAETAAEDQDRGSAENYYATMMKMAKIRSVSQYQNKRKR